MEIQKTEPRMKKKLSIDDRTPSAVPFVHQQQQSHFFRDLEEGQGHRLFNLALR